MYDWLLDKIVTYILRKQIEQQNKKWLEQEKLNKARERLLSEDLDDTCDAFAFMLKIGFDEVEAGERLKSVGTYEKD